MPEKTRTYDLLVLIDPDLPEERRGQIIQDVKRQIEAHGSLKADSDWGTRKMAFEIKHRPEAQYHLFQFESTADLLGQLDHALKIEDAVLRHRIIEGAAPIEDKPPPRPGSGRQQAPVASASEPEVAPPSAAAPEDGVSESEEPPAAAPTDAAPARE